MTPPDSSQPPTANAAHQMNDPNKETINGLLDLLQTLLNRAHTQGQDDYREWASDSAVKRHYDEFEIANSNFRNALVSALTLAATPATVADGLNKNDEERLNWLQEQWDNALNPHVPFAGGIKLPTAFCGIKNVRHAIDAAMSATKGGAT